MITGIGLFFILRPKQTKSDTIVTEKNTLIKESLKQNTLMKVDKIIESLETAE